MTDNTDIIGAVFMQLIEWIFNSVSDWFDFIYYYWFLNPWFFFGVGAFVVLIILRFVLRKVYK